jgi:hypothetical protein
MIATDFARNKFSTGLRVNAAIKFPYDFSLTILCHGPGASARRGKSNRQSVASSQKRASKTMPTIHGDG